MVRVWAIAMPELRLNTVARAMPVVSIFLFRDNQFVIMKQSPLFNKYLA